MLSHSNPILFSGSWFYGLWAWPGPVLRPQPAPLGSLFGSALFLMAHKAVLQAVSSMPLLSKTLASQGRVYIIDSWNSGNLNKRTPSSLSHFTDEESESWRTNDFQGLAGSNGTSDMKTWVSAFSPTFPSSVALESLLWVKPGIQEWVLSANQQANLMGLRWLQRAWWNREQTTRIMRWEQASFLLTQAH